MNFTPALRFRFLTRFYDAVISRSLPEGRFRQALMLQASLRPGLRVLDFGAGTGTLTLLAKEECPCCEVIGVDVDSAILQTARRKRDERGLDVAFQVIADHRLPFPGHHFDRVLSSLVFHHIAAPQKSAALREIRRVLRPDGELHVADWGQPASALLRLGFFTTQLLDGFETTAAHADGVFPRMVEEAGFHVVPTGHFATAFGSLRLFCGRPR